MPTYDYVCKKCEHTFEVRQSFSDPPVADCPECRSEVRKKISGGLGTIFRGSGFYINDSQKKSAAGRSADSAGASTGNTDKSDKSDNTDKSEKTVKTNHTPVGEQSKSKVKECGGG